LHDLVEIKKGLSEAEAKELKNINKKNFEKITKYAKVHPGDQVVTFLLDSLTKFFSGDAKATFVSQGAPYFTSADDLQQ
jgi:hypothetical protein